MPLNKSILVLWCLTQTKNKYRILMVLKSLLRTRRYSGPQHRRVTRGSRSRQGKGSLRAGTSNRKKGRCATFRNSGCASQLCARALAMTIAEPYYSSGLEFKWCRRRHRNGRNAGVLRARAQSVRRYRMTESPCMNSTACSGVVHTIAGCCCRVI